MQTHPRSNFCLLAPAKLFKLLPPFGGVDPVGPGLEWAPTSRNLQSKPTPRSNFCLLSHTQLFQLIPLFDRVDPAGPLVGVSPPKLNFTKQTHPKEQLLFAGPRPILIANNSIWWSRPCRPGVGAKFSKKTHSKKQLLFAGPGPIINPSGNFRRGHCAGYPWGLTFWVAPWLYKLLYKYYL